MGEFITFISVIKQMEEKQELDSTYAGRVFSCKRSNSITVSPKVRVLSKWDAAMDRVDQDTLDAGEMMIGVYVVYLCFTLSICIYLHPHLSLISTFPSLLICTHNLFSNLYTTYSVGYVIQVYPRNAR